MLFIILKNLCSYSQMIIGYGLLWLNVMKRMSFTCWRRQSSVTEGLPTVMTEKQ
uniref:Uncharacterized protein n=1 Tax=Rhizophora mucronata TaxID=61149 RepID=A0A2P2J6M7_RHIMU